jgi:hypothetical protein
MLLAVRALEPRQARPEIAAREVPLDLPVHEPRKGPGLGGQARAQRGVARPDDATQPDIVWVAFFEGPAWLLTIRLGRDEPDARGLRSSTQAKESVVPWTGGLRPTSVGESSSRRSTTDALRRRNYPTSHPPLDPLLKTQARLAT